MNQYFERSLPQAFDAGWHFEHVVHTNAVVDMWMWIDRILG